MEYGGKIVSPDIEEMKQLVQKKASQTLNEFTEDNLDYFVKEASIIAESTLEKFIFAVYDMFVTGKFSIKDLTKKEAFTNPRTGYQQKMLEWKEQNKPKVHSSKLFSLSLQKPSEKHWYYATLGAGTAGAIGLGIYCYRDGWTIGRCCWVGLAIELLTLIISYYLFNKEKKEMQKYEEQCKQYESEISRKTDLFVNEVIDSLETWIKQGENYSKELLTTFNL